MKKGSLALPGLPQQAARRALARKGLAQSCSAFHKTRAALSSADLRRRPEKAPALTSSSQPDRLIFNGIHRAVETAGAHSRVLRLSDFRNLALKRLHAYAWQVSAARWLERGLQPWDTQGKQIATCPLA